jgi:hypothetical protein
MDITGSGVLVEELVGKSWRERQIWPAAETFLGNLYI